MKALKMMMLAACLMLAGAVPAFAQAYMPGRAVADFNPQPTKAVCWNGSAYAACSSVNAANVVTRAPTSVSTTQVSVGTTATQVVAARVGRGRVTLNVGSANTCAFGNAGVTLSTGYPLQPVAGSSLVLESGAAVFAVCSATTTVGAIETF